MNTYARPLAFALALGLLALGGCRDKHEPVKPTVQTTAVPGQDKLSA